MLLLCKMHNNNSINGLEIPCPKTGTTHYHVQLDNSRAIKANAAKLSCFKPISKAILKAGNSSIRIL